MTAEKFGRFAITALVLKAERNPAIIGLIPSGVLAELVGGPNCSAIIKALDDDSLHRLLRDSATEAEPHRPVGIVIEYYDDYSTTAFTRAEVEG